MDYLQFLTQAVLYSIPAVILLITVYTVLKSFFRNEERKRMYELKMNTQKTSLPIRLQAYERMILLLERLAPNNLIWRVKKSGMSASALQAALLMEIRSEFDHNLSQQLYVSPSAWNMVKNSKEEIIKLINISHAHLKPKATAMDLSKAIFDNVMQMEHPPTYKAILYIKKEAHDFL
jgi:hypothetical protein